MNLLNKLERKFGRYAIHNLSTFIIAGYAAGYLISLIAPQMIYYITLDPYYILHGQVWRLISWILLPPGSFSFFTIIMLYFYYSVGNLLERTWGAFRYNVYIFSGILINIIGAFALYFFLGGGRITMGGIFTTYYVNMTIFFAFAATYPDISVYLYFFIPIKMKWLALIDAALMIFEFFSMNWVGKFVMLLSMLNFIIYFIFSRKGSYRRSAQKINYNFQKAKAAHEQKMKEEETTRTKNHVITRHKCAVCGRTELDDPNIEFRFCTKCDGNYEYCSEHIYTHTHVTKGE